MRYRQAASAATVVACAIGAVTASATAASSDVATAGSDATNSSVHSAPTASVVVPGKPGESARTGSSNSQHMSSAAMQTAPNTADVEFVRMMIPHHYQALVMTRLVPERSADEDVRALAERINVEQSVEIDAMQGWQDRHGLQVTDAPESYQRVLEQPELLEQMGMATPAELDDLRAAEGTAFDVLFLQLMIEHHEGAVRMAEQVVINGSDVSLRQMAINMLSTQNSQIQDMQETLEQKTS